MINTFIEYNTRKLVSLFFVIPPFSLFIILVNDFKIFLLVAFILSAISSTFIVTYLSVFDIVYKASSKKKEFAKKIEPLYSNGNIPKITIFPAGYVVLITGVIVTISFFTSLFYLFRGLEQNSYLYGGLISLEILSVFVILFSYILIPKMVSEFGGDFQS